MPIIGDSANQDLCQESLLIDPKIESVEEVVITGTIILVQMRT